MKPLHHTYPVQRTRMALNSILPEKPVRRRVQGVDLVLPRSHPLPLFTQGDSTYGVNLVELARGLGVEGDLTMLDVGANVGDSAARALDAVAGRARVVCLEPDPAWLPYLEQNAAAAGNVVIERAFLVPTPVASTMVPVHHSPGTTRFEAVETGTDVVSLTPDALLERHPELAGVRLIKTDTDGYDVSLVPALARTFAASRPVIFFEYDPRLTRLACPEVDPASVWDALIALGYDHLAIWTHGGTPIGRVPTARVHDHLGMLVPPPGASLRKSKDYWDVAAVHAEDFAGHTLIERLVPPVL